MRSAGTRLTAPLRYVEIGGRVTCWRRRRKSHWLAITAAPPPRSGRDTATASVDDSASPIRCRRRHRRRRRRDVRSNSVRCTPPDRNDNDHDDVRSVLRPNRPARGLLFSVVVAAAAAAAAAVAAAASVVVVTTITRRPASFAAPRVRRTIHSTLYVPRLLRLLLRRVQKRRVSISLRFLVRTIQQSAVLFKNAATTTTAASVAGCSLPSTCVNGTTTVYTV